MSSSLVLRRADAGDISAIHQLIANNGQDKLLRRRFSEDALDIQKTLDTSHVAIVGVQNGHITGFIAINTAPPRYVDASSFKSEDNMEYHPENLAAIENRTPICVTAWDQWISSSFELENMNIFNTAFVTLFVTEPNISAEFLDKTLEYIFRILPKVDTIGYFLPESLVLFQPFSSPRWEQPEQGGTGESVLLGDGLDRKSIKKYRLKPLQKYFSEVKSKNENAKFSLHVISRDAILPVMTVRRARVEDCDDLIPMLQRRNLLKVDHPDYFLAELVESKSPAIRNLVAEACGVVVGFMSINRAVDEHELIQKYHLGKFDNLRRDPTISSDDNEPNAFCITMFCIEEEYAMQASKLIKAAFEVFPAREFCLLTLPPGAPFIPLLYHFTPFDPSPEYPNGHTLYVANRYGFDKNLHVRHARPEDEDAISCLLDGTAVKDHSFQAFKDSIQSSSKQVYHTYVCEDEDQIVSIIQLETCQDAQSYTDQFEIEFFLEAKKSTFQGQHVLLRHAIFNPLFERCARLVFSEVMRLENLSFILFPVDNVGKEDTGTQQIALREFVPLKSRRMIEFPNRIRDGKIIPKPMTYQIQILPRSLLYEPRIDVNQKIVVLGGSNVGIAFLEKLIYTPHLRFTNLTLVSEDGEPSLDDKLLTNDLTYTATELKQLAIGYYVKVISGSANALNREKKQLVLTNGDIIPYDFLIMVPGTQYRVSSSLDETFEGVDGVISITKKVMTNLKSIANQYLIGEDSKIVLYGRSLQAYVTLKYLLELGLPKHRLIFVDPRGPKDLSCFNNSIVEELIEKALNQSAVTRITGSKIYKWLEDSSVKSYRRLSSIVLKDNKTDSKTKIDNVHLFLYADERSVSPDTFKLVNDACLVFDGRLVISRDFKTDDPAIFGAGSVTKYASKYKTEWTHSHFDAKEIGVTSANYILPRIDPTGVTPYPPPLDESEAETIRVFYDSKKVEASLPGNYYYLHYDRPRLPLMTLEERRKRPNYGRDLVLKSQPGEFFRIHVDPSGYIRSMTYLGVRRISTLNYLALYGLHEKYLNRLVARFDEGVITDFIPFLQETWALPLYYDRFKYFVQSLKSNAMNQNTSEIKDLLNEFEQNIKTGKKVTDRELKYVYQKFDYSEGRKELDRQVFDYLIETDIFRSYP